MLHERDQVSEAVEGQFLYLPFHASSGSAHAPFLENMNGATDLPGGI